MLCELYIRDFVIAKELNLEFADGLTVLTGETGAGKSILIGALGLVLGARADTKSVREGCDQADISAVFDARNHQTIKNWLIQHEVHSDDECVLRRVVHRNGRSRAFINGQPVPVQQLRELGAQLVEIHGQHEHQAMLKPTVQRTLLDDCGQYSALLEQVATHFGQWKEQTAALADLTARLHERSARLDLLRFQTDELEKLAPQDDEFAQLSEEQYRLSHTATLAEASSTALTDLTGEDGGAQAALARAKRALATAAEIDSELQDVSSLLDEADIQLGEAVSGLQRYHSTLDMDPNRRDSVEQRLDAISGAAKKHRVEPAQLQAHLNTLLAELSELGNAEESLALLEDKVDKAAKAYVTQAAKLTKARKKSAKALAKEISELVRELGMPECEFNIAVNSNKDTPWRSDGMDQIEFMLQANPGEAMRPVSKVASGGELSRLSLAIQVIVAGNQGAACMVFDEVDAGVGGAVADMIGKRLQELGINRQVFSVTHLPQVACHGHQHFKVSKTSIEARTRSQVTQLSDKQRVEELARMLGGATVTATTRRHARELLKSAQSTEKSA